MFFGKTEIKQGRIPPATSNWGSNPSVYIRTFFETVQPYTGDDHFVNDQFAQEVRDLITISDMNFDIKFDDVLYYDGSFKKVVYAKPSKNGPIPHIEVITADYKGNPPTWI